MLFCCALLVFGVTVYVAADTNNAKVTVSKMDTDAQCSYTLTVPAVKCSNDSVKKLSSRIDAMEKLSQQQLRQQQFALLELNYKLQNYLNEQNKLQNVNDDQNNRIKQLESALKRKEKKNYLDCAEYQSAGQPRSGVYNVTLEHAQSPLSVWCDMDTRLGGWTVIQRRQDGSVDFFNDWATYKEGFGNIDGEFWLGNDNIYHLTNQKGYSLRVDMWTFDGKYYWAEYENFFIENEAHNYTLHVGSYMGTAGDKDVEGGDNHGLSSQNNLPFSTKDRNNDGNNCSNQWNSAFWFKNCYRVNLNGFYRTSNNTSNYHGVHWHLIDVETYVGLKKVEMKIRP